MKALIVSGLAVAALTCALSLLCTTCSPSAPAGPPPNVVVIVLDTARPDFLSAYGHPRPTSPFLDEFARAGTRFDRAYSVSGWTLPAHASMFSGLSPDVHGANNENQQICDSAPLLAERLSDAGYQTAGFSNNPWVAAKTGLARGFQVFLEKLNRQNAGVERLANGTLDHPTVRAVDAWFARQRDKSRPFFLFVNLIEPHLPYKPPWEAAQPFFASREELQAAIHQLFPTGKASTLQNRHYSRKDPLGETEWDLLRRLYEGELRLTDTITRALIDTVDRESDPGQTLVFIVSDHGENIGDHGHISHMFNLYDSNLRIVCLARGPGFAAGEVRSDLVQITDLYPTILRAAALEPERSCVGVDLRGDRAPARSLRAMLDFPSVSLSTFPPETVASGVLDAYKHELLSVVAPDFKAIRASGGATEYFDLLDDPGETKPLANGLDTGRRALGDALARPLGPPLCTHASGPDFDDKTREELRALGYAGDEEGDTKEGAPAVLEVALVATDAADPAARAYEYRGVQVRLVELRALAVERASVKSDARGSLLLEFELAPTDAAGLAALTRANIGRTLATLIDGKVMLTTPIGGELPGVGMMSLGPAATRSELEELARRMMAKR